MIDEILKNTKMLMDVTGGDKDEILTFYINDVVEAILAHCRIDFLPKQLYGLVSQIAAHLAGNGAASIKSLTEGERRVEFSDSPASPIRDFYDRLSPFVNRAGRVPSEVDNND